MDFNSLAHTVFEAEVTLYLADETGAPLTSNPLWLGADADQVQIADRWLKVETRPTGAKYPKRHPLVPQYEISMARVWALPLADLVGFRPMRNNYVLDVLWTDEETQDWHRETFYGVTISERARASRDPNSSAGEFVENQVFDAQEMVPSSGQGVPPAIDADLPYTVRYVDENGNPTNIYKYDANAKTFSAVGDPSALAVLTPTSTSFQVTFGGSGSPELEAGLAELDSSQLREGAPSAGDLPRVDFYYGTTRLASVTRWGEIFAQSFFDGVQDPQGKTGVFQLRTTGGTLVATIDQTRITAPSFNEFTPANVTGLKLWCDITSLTNVGDGVPLASWTDQSGNGKDLVQVTAENQPTLSRARVDPTTNLDFAADGLPSVRFNNVSTNIIPLIVNGNVVQTYDGDGIYIFNKMQPGKNYLVIFGPNDAGMGLGAHGGGGSIDNPGAGIPVAFTYQGDDGNDTEVVFASVGGVPSKFTAQIIPLGSQFLETATGAVDTQTFTLFVLAWQQKNSGAIVNSGFDGGPDDDPFNDIRLLRPLGTDEIKGSYFEGGHATESVATSSAGTNPAYAWQVIELQLSSSGVLTGVINGTQVCSVNVTGDIGSNTLPIALGKAVAYSVHTTPTDPVPFNGYVRALLVYGANPSDADKDKIRKYLGRLYSNAASSAPGRDVNP